MTGDCHACPLATVTVMSALGQKQTFAVQNVHVRFTPKSGHVRRTRDVRFVPIADIGSLLLLRNKEPETPGPSSAFVATWFPETRRGLSFGHW